MRKKSPTSEAAHTTQLQTASARVFLEGQVVGLRPGGNVRFRSATHGEIVCRLPHGIAVTWLEEALSLGPVDAEGTFSAETGRGSVWALFPTEEQRVLVPKHQELAARESVSLRCGKSVVSLEKDGAVQIRGRDIISRGSRSQRISGGTVKIN